MCFDINATVPKQRLTVEQHRGCLPDDETLSHVARIPRPPYTNGDSARSSRNADSLAEHCQTDRYCTDDTRRATSRRRYTSIRISCCSCSGTGRSDRIPRARAGRFLQKSLTGAMDTEK